MVRAKEYLFPGLIWHLTHRCHNRKFLLKFAKDRKRWLDWIFQAKKRYGLTILNYTITSNHIHILVIDEGRRDAIPRSIQLASGRTAREFNIRKKRSGAFWEDQYHATAIESGKHLVRCMIYIDMNMVRAERVKHPKDWPHSGYKEIMGNRKRYRLIDKKKLCNWLYLKDENNLKEYYGNLIETEQDNNHLRDAKWTESLAIGEEEYVQKVKKLMGVSALHRSISEVKGDHVLKEQASPYMHDFAIKMGFLRDSYQADE